LRIEVGLDHVAGPDVTVGALDLNTTGGVALWALTVPVDAQFVLVLGIAIGVDLDQGQAGDGLLYAVG
jgi:hypothetical protein